MRKKPVNLPIQPALQRALIGTIGDLHDQARANLALTESLLDYVAKLDARTSGLSAVAKVVDENEESAILERQVNAAKDLINYTFREAHSYVVIVVAAGFAAYFTTISTLSQRLDDGELYLSALLMTVSLTVFVFWEIVSMTYLGWLSVTNRIGQAREVPRWYRLCWPVALFLSVATALPAVGLSAMAYLEGLQRQQSTRPSTSNPPFVSVSEPSDSRSHSNSTTLGRSNPQSAQSSPVNAHRAALPAEPAAQR